jgi:hypothetical protein
MHARCLRRTCAAHIVVRTKRSLTNRSAHELGLGSTIIGQELGVGREKNQAAAYVG